MDSPSGCRISGAELAHGILGWKAMSAELARTGASPDLLADLATGWYLGSMAMVAFAVIVTATWLEARGKGPAGRTAAATIGLTYFTFGLLAFFFDHSAHISSSHL